MSCRRVLGLDVGTNSVGWAVIEENAETGAPHQLIDLGVRIFTEPVEPKTRTPKNQQRRAARLARRVVQRRRRRKKKLINILVKHHLLPSGITDFSQRETILNQIGEPYALRRKGLDHPLTRQEFGRILLHLCARRGFQSNRKTLWGSLVSDPDAQDLLPEIEESSDGDEGKVLSEISSLQTAIAESNSRTLGEYLSGLEESERKRARYTDRSMYKSEFERLWNVQCKDLGLDDSLKADIHNTIFHQRPIRIKPGTIGRCSLENRRQRAAKARLDVQEFLLRQDVNHLAVRNPETGFYDDLSPGERRKLADALHSQRTMTWSAARKLLDRHKGETFNLEDAGTKKHLNGNQTNARLKSILGDAWEDLDNEQKTSLVEDLLTIQDKKPLFKRLRRFWKLDRETAFRLATLELVSGYSNHSVRAISRLLVHLRTGMKYAEARQAAGYGYEEETVRTVNRLPLPPDLRNPVVNKSLHEIRRVVNAVLHHIGPLDVIRVELAREMKMNAKQKSDYERQQKKNQRLNLEAAEKVELELGTSSPSHDDLLKYRLWIECEGVCPYTGASISMSALYGGDVDIEHIVPFSRSLDNSYMNKTLCMADENRKIKKNQTPYEAYGQDKERWKQIRQRIRKFPYRKRSLMTDPKPESLEGFVSRQLNDTRFIGRAAKDYLAQTGADINVTRGAHTALIRHHWGLNSLLSHGDTKTRDDHRHHAVDAFVIALTSRGLYQRIAGYARRHRSSPMEGDFRIEEPWKGMRQNLSDHLDSIIVSHSPDRRIKGAFHEDTAYGKRYLQEHQDYRYVYRKPLDGLTRSEAKRVVDVRLRDYLVNLPDSYWKNGKLLVLEDQPIQHPVTRRSMRRVRLFQSFGEDSVLRIQHQNGGADKFHPFGNNHSVFIYLNRDEKISAEFVTTHSAALQARSSSRRTLQERQEADLLMILKINDMVSIDTEDGDRDFYRVQSLDPASNRIVLRLHSAASDSDQATRIGKATTTLISNHKMERIHLDALGKVIKSDGASRGGGDESGVSQ